MLYVEHTYEPKLIPQVIIPRRYAGCDHGSETIVLAYEGDLKRLFGANGTASATVSRALAWRKAGKAWHGRMEGYRSEPAALMLVECAPNKRCAYGLGTTLHAGGRLSYGLLAEHADVIDRFFGAHVNVDTRRTVEITRRVIKLTPAQARMLADVRKRGEVRYNGRAEKQIRALHAHGLIDYEYTFREVGPYGGRYVDSYTVKPT